MQVEVAETGPCSRTLTIVVPPDKVQAHLDQMYESASHQVQLKGFRPGKVPRRVLEKRFGPGILQEAKEQIVNNCFNEACRDKQIVPVGRANIDDFDKLEVALGRALQFTVRVDVRPTFELKKVTGTPVDAYETTASEQDVDNALKEIANQKRAIKKVESPAEDGDFLKADLRFVDADGNQVHERKAVQLNTRIPVAGTDPAAFAKALIGATVGSGIELALTFPDNFEKDQVRGKPGVVTLQVHEVLRVTPAPIDEALAKSLDFASVDALKADLQQRISDEKVRVGKARQEEQCLEAALQGHDFALPQSLVDEQARVSLGQFADRLKQSGMAEPEVEKKLVESKDEAQTDAKRRVKLFFLIDAIARKEKIFVTEGDMETEVRSIAQSNNASPQQVIEFLEKNNQIGELRLAILERKVRNFLRDNAKITDRKGK
jgi:trigger factor